MRLYVSVCLCLQGACVTVCVEVGGQELEKQQIERDV